MILPSILRKFGPQLEPPPQGFHREYGGNVVSLDFWSPPYALRDGYPPHDDTYEWVDLLEALDDAHEEFVAIELGAGFGRWATAAGVLARRFRPKLKTHLVAVEAEPRHFEWTRQTFIHNDLDPAAHTLIEAAAAGTDGVARFVVGNAREWYGQALAHVFEDSKHGWHYDDRPEAETVEVKAVSLNSLCEPFERVDLIHMDVQNSEADVIASSRETIARKVRRMHVATHSPEVEREIQAMLSEDGWLCAASFPTKQTCPTQYGPITFDDGVQSWINPRLF